MPRCSLHPATVILKRILAPAAVLLTVLGGLSLGWAQHDHHDGAGHGAAGPVTDTRQFVRFPDALRDHTLANMRDHLLALQEIQLHLGMGTTMLPQKLRNPASECHPLACMARPRWPNTCRRECRMQGRPCTALPVALRSQPKMLALPAIRSQCLPGWRTLQLSASVATPDTGCNSSRSSFQVHE